jgi:hypothetical protein
MNFWESFGGAVGGTATALVLIGFFGRTLFEHWFKKDFKLFEVKLDSISKRQEIAFSRLHEKRAEIIAALYEKLVRLHHTFNRLAIYKSYTTDQEPASPPLAKMAKDIYDSASSR